MSDLYTYKSINEANQKKKSHDHNISEVNTFTFFFIPFAFINSNVE